MISRFKRGNWDPGTKNKTWEEYSESGSKIVSMSATDELVAEGQQIEELSASSFAFLKSLKTQE